jgi:predicted ester cyclase
MSSSTAIGPTSVGAEQEHNKALVRRLMHGLYGERNVDVIDEVAAPDFTGSIPGRSFDSPEAWKAYNRGSLGAFPDFAYTIDDLFAEGDRVALRWTLTATHMGPYGGLQPTGMRIEVSGIFICQCADGKIAKSWGVWDTATVMRQLGVQA